jgi:hypothetical protein
MTLRPSDSVMIANWCRVRGLAWAPWRAQSGTLGVLISRPGQARAEACMISVRGDEFTLAAPGGATLAAASDLPAVFDALDAGVADAPLPRLRVAATAGAGQALVRAA